MNANSQGAKTPGGEKPWGYEVRIVFNNGDAPKIFHKQGSLAKVHLWAVMKPNHYTHTILGSYTREQWIRCFGDSRLRS
jgi:hypothetical protein